MTPLADVAFGAGVRVEFHTVRILAERKGLLAERAMMRGHVRLQCSNGAYLKRPNGSWAFSYDLAWRFLQHLPDLG